MTTKEWLSRGWKLNQEIDALIEAQTRARNLAYGITSATTGGNHGSNKPKSKVESHILIYMQYEQMINDRIDNLYQIQKEILDTIKKVDNSLLRTILISRYVNFKKWEKIAVEINYDYYHVIKYLHPKALSMIKIPPNTT